MKTLKQIIKQDCFFVPTFAKSEVGIPIPPPFGRLEADIGTQLLPFKKR